ncbi:TlpA family protein disulfide reductase [Membranicola marinus]|uniref:TlpA family protein disulfide reductase n=1 Tax=Membranihabitans marinus TaxID=1227546 RepID=A0A953HMN8_9BACT|nr:TlpA disulfide reductase family protein [Membranihabitans marinus]MBY5958447.1 TlpA family protein disulfide reductase [Membranihabitans marinus]
MKKKTKRNLIEFGVVAVVALTLYLTGLHTEVIGFVQRGLLATGVMNPKIEQAEASVSDSASEKADLNFDLVNEAGETVSMKSFEGKVIFMNIWATWCPPCIAEMPSIQSLYDEVDGPDVEFVMLSVDDDFQKAIDYRKRKGYDFNIYRVKSGLPRMYHSSAIPTTYIIGANGNLEMTHKGMANYGTDKFKNFVLGLR